MLATECYDNNAIIVHNSNSIHQINLSTCAHLQEMYVIVIPRSPGIYRGKPPDPEGAARGRGVVFRDKSMVTVYRYYISCS